MAGEVAICEDKSLMASVQRLESAFLTTYGKARPPGHDLCGTLAAMQPPGGKQIMETCYQKYSPVFDQLV